MTPEYESNQTQPKQDIDAALSMQHQCFHIKWTAVLPLDDDSN